LTFLFTDIEGSTALLERIGHDAYVRVLSDHHEIVRARLAEHGGREIDTQGDSFFVVFASATACIAAAIEIQRALAAHPWREAVAVRVRMGLHSGEAAETSAGLVGFDVHRAARVAAVAHGGQVLVSETSAALIRTSLPSDWSLKDLGPHRLKDLGRTQQIFQLQATGLDFDFPPLCSLDNPALAHNLPARTSSFIGREQELGDVRALVADSRLVTLVGAGGCGKSQLALQVAAGALDGSGDGVWLVELAPLSDEASIVSAICANLGIAIGADRSGADALLEALVPQSLLLVLDNCEHLIAGSARVAEAILRRCPRVRLLATSREPLGIAGESVYRVPSLSLPDLGTEDLPAVAATDSVALLIERAREQGVKVALDRETAPLIASICRRLDGMPLAIELATARLRSLPLSTVHDLLDQRFRLLTGGSRTALERQQTLRATVDWSYSLLTESERVLVRRLSVFVGEFDLKAAVAVCAFDSFDELDVADGLGSLVDKSLVAAESDGSRVHFRLLETIRQFVAERLIEHDQQEAIGVAARHCEHFLAVAEAAAVHLHGRDPASWFQRLDRQQSNFRRALEHAIDEPARIGMALRFVAALRYYWYTRSRRREALELILPVLDRPEARTEPELLARAVLTAAGCAMVVDLPTTRKLVRRAGQLARELGDDVLLTWSEMALAATWLLGGEEERGAAALRDCLARAQRLGDDDLLGECLLLNVTASQRCERFRTDGLYGECLAFIERRGDLLFAHDLHQHAAADAIQDGDLAAARAHLDLAADAGRTIGAAPHYVESFAGILLLNEGDRAGARSTLESAVRSARRAGDRYHLAFAYLGLALLAADTSEPHRAAELHGAADALADRLGRPWLRFERLRRASIDALRASLGKGDFERAYQNGRAHSPDAVFDLAVDASTGSASAPQPRPSG
ncbi:MAG: adenylate/guanylate cyclase domain-containing protein, partial [Solirubrobacteraceae bacterium]